MEKESNSLIEVMKILSSVESSLIERKQQEFLPLKVKQIINSHVQNLRSTTMKDELVHVYERGILYLQKWTASFQEFKIFEWMLLEDKPSWDNIENCILYLVEEKGLQINDSMLFDQLKNLNIFLDEIKKTNNEFATLSADLKWVKYFEERTEAASSEFLKICFYFFAIPGHNANVERIFSMMKATWTDQRNRLMPESIKKILVVQYNFKNLTCEQFYDYCLRNKGLLKEVRSKAKYDFSVGAASSSC